MKQAIPAQVLKNVRKYGSARQQLMDFNHEFSNQPREPSGNRAFLTEMNARSTT
jgi:hypothetical protein